MASLTLENVSKVFRTRAHDVTAVVDLDLAVADGEIIALLGSSGCGKTSTLRLITGFETITAGTIRIGDQVINGLPAAQRNVAMAFEGYALYPPLSIWDNIAFGLLRDRRPRTEVQDTVQAIARLLAIEDILERYPPTLSGGQQQRVSLARALVRSAEVYLLDEPMSQLEPQLRAVLRARIKDYLIRNRMTTVFVTHDQTEAMALADRIAVMEMGRLQQFAAPDDLKERPSNLFVASFIGEPPMNIFPARVAGDSDDRRLAALTEDGQEAFAVPCPRPATDSDRLADGQEIFLGIRPHRVRVGSEALAAGGHLSGSVLSNQWLGDQSHVGIAVAGALLIAVADRSVPVGVDETIPFALPEDALHVFDRRSQRALLHGRRRAEG